MWKGDNMTEKDNTNILQHETKPILISTSSTLIGQESKFGKVKNNLKEIIKSKGLSQVELANAVGITKATISNIINNKFQTSMEMGFRIAEYLDMSLEDIFYYEKSDGSIYESTNSKTLKNVTFNISEKMHLIFEEQEKMKKVIEKVTATSYDELTKD
jgi:putative transcriptional regulator